jgi:hypothetical protein
MRARIAAAIRAHPLSQLPVNAMTPVPLLPSLSPSTATACGTQRRGRFLQRFLPRTGLAATACCLAASLLLPAPARAQPAWPNAPIRMVIPFAPGAANDAVGRIIANPMSTALGTTIVVDNRPGAGGNLGAEIAARAPADGFTLFLANVSHATSASLYDKLGYDLQKDLAPISLAANSPHVLIAHPSLPVKTVQDVIALARARPGQLSWASQGNGTLSHLEQELLRVAEGIKTGQRARVPMGLIFVGPMGTGKTFLAEAFARESGLTCLKLKNFREKWVGSTEGNLEKILQVVDGLGYVLLIIDEADRSLSGGAEGDGGTSSRVIARLKEFMSDTSHRGRVVILMMTNRPDKLDVDLKRPGRFDVKIPFFFPETPEERRQITAAVLRKSQLQLAPGATLEPVVAGTVGYSAAEIEAVVLAAANFAAWEERQELSEADLARAVVDLIPSRDLRMLEYMELLAVFESSARRMLPERYQGMTTQEVQARLDVVRAQLGARLT